MPPKVIEWWETRCLDLSEPASERNDVEYFIVGNPSGPIRLTEPQGRSVLAGIRSDLCPLPIGERLVRRAVTVITTAWEEVT